MARRKWREGRRDGRRRERQRAGATPYGWGCRWVGNQQAGGRMGPGLTSHAAPNTLSATGMGAWVAVRACQHARCGVVRVVVVP